MFSQASVGQTEIEKSHSIGPELKQAIKDSRIAVVIFSKNYASSSWCLNELLEIVKCREECGQMVIPVFYRLDPSHVRNQTGEFEEVKIRWSEALTNVANILGYHSVIWGNEADMVEKIANDVIEKLLLTPAKDSEDFVGIEDHIAKLSMLLQLEAEEVMMVGLWGSSGIGKTTIARVLFNRLSRHFQGSIFIDMAFVSKRKGDIKINHLSAVEERLKNKKVLIFIDDVSDQVVLDALIGHMGLNTFTRKKSPPEGFDELVVEITRLVGSLPLGLNVLGSSLRGRDMEYWIDLLPRLQNGIDGKIEKTLRISYDGLSSEDKAIFRHVACLFNGAKVTNLKLLLADSGLNVNIGLKNLADRSLIHLRKGHVEMHRLLQEMGKKVVRLEKPENQEFLMDSQDICDVLSEGIGPQKVIGITLDIDEIDEFYVHKSAFTRMRNLRFLKLYSRLRLYREVKLQLHGNFNYLPPKLKLLHWDEFPMRYMPSKFRPENLVELIMEDSKLEKLWEGILTLPCLKEMDLSGSQNLIEMPDLSKATNLETLKLRNCYSLVKLPSSIPHPNKLTTINLKNCRNLETIPIGISLKSLEVLNLYGCSMLRTIPLFSVNISHLSIDETSIEEIPSNFRLENLSYLSMKNIKSEKLWERVQPLTLLTTMLSPSLNQFGCSRLRTFPDISTNIGRLYLSETGIEKVPRWIEKLSWLRVLYLNGCINLETLPTGINLQSLYVLDLSGCSRLRDFPDISTNIKVIWMKGCNKLEYVNLNFSKLTRLEEVDFSDCLNLDKEALFQQRTYLGCQLWFSGEEVPSYFNHRTTGTSSSSYLTVHLLPSSLSQSILRFRACLVLYDNYVANFRFKGRFWNSFDSFGQQAQDFWGETEYYSIKPFVKGSHLLILDCDIHLSIGSDILAEMNYTHVDLQLDFPSEYELKEWGIRLCSLAENQLGNPNTLPHVFETDEGNMLNHGGEGEECGGNDEVTERSSKRMRVNH
ncbi:BnaC02g47170D [Brassica napus]|uniref:BnaC02g47170D protein n=1 Tax=Brassica napus TaxID=3708 RepID=A0A078IYK7_BRANA|nr:BnaC02g47170D [Brassica napus]